MLSAAAPYPAENGDSPGGKIGSRRFRVLQKQQKNSFADFPVSNV